MLAWLLIPSALAGYGDPTDGLPSAQERSLHLWTNAVRADPMAFEDDYRNGGCSTADFSSSEKTPKAPLYLEAGLAEAARFHTDDMAETGRLSHDSSDGTGFAQRLARYYPSGMVGENVAAGYPDERFVVVSGWMCSKDGHRGNIMEGGFDELGVGVVGSYYTQDFGGRGISGPAIAMAAHTPIVPSGTVDFRGDWNGGGDPDSYVVVLDGEAHDLAREVGDGGLGIFHATVTVEAGGCHSYFVEATAGGVTTRFPEDGSYGWGDCDWDDADAKWIADQVGGDGPADDDGRGGGDGDGLQLVGCATTPAASFGAWALALILVRRRRS